MVVKFRVTTRTTEGEFVEIVELTEEEMNEEDDKAAWDELCEYVEENGAYGGDETYVESRVEMLNDDGTVARVLREFGE